MAQRPVPAANEVRTAAICALFVAIGPISLALYTPALPALVTIFDTTASALKLTVTVYFLGFALALLICGPLSDAIGRRPVVLSFFSIYLVGSVVAALADSVHLLMAGRVLQGIGAAAGIAASRALVRDQFTGQPAARIMNLVGLMVGIAPAVSPTVGGVLLSVAGWHAIFYSMVLYGLIGVAAAWGLRETNLNPDRALMRPRRVLRTYGILLRDRKFLRSSLLMGLVLGGLYTFPALMPFALIERVGLSPLQFGFAMMAQTIAYILGAVVTGRLLRRFDADLLVTVGLVLVMVAGAGFAVGLRIGPPTLWTVWGPAALWVFGIAFITPGASTSALDGYPEIAGSAGALLGFMQFAGGLLASAFAALFLADAIVALRDMMPALAAAAAAVRFGIKRNGPTPRMPPTSAV